MISINATLLAQVIHFLILMFILNRLMFQPLLKLMRDRKEYTDETSKKIISIENDAERLRQEFISKEDNARKSATEERAEYRGEGIVESNELIEESRKEVEAIKAKADNEIEAEVAKTQPLLNEEAAVLAGEITERVIGRRLSA